MGTLYQIPMPGRLLAFLLIAGLQIRCADEEATSTIPTVATSNVTGITASSATSGGTVISDGNEKVKAYGIVYSSTNQSPSLNDGHTTLQPSQDTFHCTLSDLSVGTLYHVRAYATNRVGTGYGETVSFTTASFVSNIRIIGHAVIDSVLAAAYTYSDGDRNLVPETSYTWYRANDTMGTGEAVIDGAIGNRYTVAHFDEFKYLSVGIKTRTSDTPWGPEVRSAYVGPVPEARQQVIFTYNGQLVTYEVITSPATGRKWLDRNLGAKRRATATDDHLAYGDLFQWGRSADGHQLIDWEGTNKGTPMHPTTTEISVTTVPAHALFITPTTLPLDWVNPQNNLLWQYPIYLNSPCPTGWHIPTLEEWVAENLTTQDQAFTHLKLTVAGQRRLDNGALTINNAQTLIGSYWSSTPSKADPTRVNAYNLFPATVSGGGADEYARRSSGYSCRCIENAR